MMQDLQRAKINEIAEALVEAGLLSLDEQAESVGTLSKYRLDDCEKSMQGKQVHCPHCQSDFGVA
jgi:hypothetical protein